MADEEKKEGLSFKTADELSKFLMDMQGQIANMQETIDRLSPKEDETAEPEGNAEGKDESEETMTDEEISEIDQLLQSE